MNYYINVHTRSNTEFSDSVLMNEMFFRVHKALGQFGDGNIGVSFPNFNKTLGNCLRLHGDEFSLKKLMSVPWSKDIEDYFVVGNITEIPSKVSYRMVRRIQTKSNTERLLRRSVKKGWLTETEAKQRQHEAVDVKNNKLPYIRLKSLSTNQFFHLFIEHGPTVENSQAGKFSAYGLSSTATVPWF